MLQLYLILILITRLIIHVTTNFTAAVVEFYPEPDTHLLPDDRLQKNLQSYINILAEITDKIPNLDIIVYPESGLTTNAIIRNRTDLLPFTSEVTINGVSLCNSDTYSFLNILACAAVDYSTYIVLNLDERIQCNVTEKCSPDGWELYNTNVVLNRKGEVISKYRKFNLFGEPFMNRTKKADIAIFNTDFNITFASFTCFDILFKSPAVDLVYRHGIKYVIYPSMWFSELPFLTALQSQMQWSYATNTVLLSSGVNVPKRGSGGSGIYHGINGPLTFNVVGKEESASFVSTIPKLSLFHTQNTSDIDKKAKQLDSFYCRTDNLTPYTSKLINANQTEIHENICSKEFCCKFKLQLQWQPLDDKHHYQYHMVAYSGVRSFAGMRDGGVEICGVVACLGPTLESCGKRFANYDDISWPVTFNSIKIIAKFDIDNNKFQYPNSLLSNLQPIHVDGFLWESKKQETIIERTLKLLKSQSRLMTFAIYGRDFSQDSPRV